MTQHVPLARDATLSTVAVTLHDKVQFIADAYAVMRRHEREHGPVVLRIGVSPGSKGKRPNYRIDCAKTGDYLVVIDGNNHRSWTGTISLSSDWSDGHMTCSQVGDLLLEVRNEGRSKAKAR